MTTSTPSSPPSPPLATLGLSIARELAQAHRTDKAWQPEQFSAALGIDEAYLIQDAVAAELGWSTGAWAVIKVQPGAQIEVEFAGIGKAAVTVGAR
ncbi:MAG: hypothetical protein M3Y67_02030 [Pseudomonadota bacterium]|nr:hypothetical protein [Pseudomonadota bacterium]